MLKPKLTICIATYKRGKFIGETLDSILGQMLPGVELVVVDGASPDNTPEVVTEYARKYPELHYYRESENSGVDGDYDKAVGYATGEYCWLMTDDDLLCPGAVRKVLDKLEQIDLLVVNAEVRSADFSIMLDERLIRLENDKVYGVGDEENMFRETVQGLSFIGCVVIRREVWLARDRRSYYGSLFVHVGVIFQHTPIARAVLIAEPLITIRYGNAMWTPRGMEIWIAKWPELIWSFKDFTDKTKSILCPRGGWHLIKRLVFYRATGAYTGKEYDEIVSIKFAGLTRMASKFVAIVPVTLAGFIACIYSVFLGGRGSRMIMYSLNNGQHRNAATRWAARIVGVC
ncbi:hypothetical protein MIZ01_2638 [Sideroxyarcus emersonii]|uniref:Glycosyltransferase 2-like domain-containing protein n=1 Tax=Sideroxyarcus emersonii TaxID=2764705 RepID=A0AAN1XD32_9PROT|nr:glycosyltransferase family 2 protein [Sideroxyarcus emersonii]BCK88832.1 hypothetical protein MIZ01_2638 [Sideroxyarcus emersonii]